MNPYPIINHWLHLISVVFWIGGNAYQVFVLMPSIKEGDPSNETLRKISKRFTRLSLFFLVILVVTGGINMGFRRTGHESIPSGYVSALAVKIFLVVGMSSLLVFGLVRSDDDDDEDPTAIPCFTYSRASFAIGIIVVFLASMLRQWKF